MNATFLHNISPLLQLVLRAILPLNMMFHVTVIDNSCCYTHSFHAIFESFWKPSWPVADHHQHVYFGCGFQWYILWSCVLFCSSLIYKQSISLSDSQAVALRGRKHSIQSSYIIHNFITLSCSFSCFICLLWSLVFMLSCLFSPNKKIPDVPDFSL